MPTFRSLAFAAVAAVASHAPAAIIIFPNIITVTSADDTVAADGVTTLREAFQTANTNGAGIDWIFFDASLAGATIELAAIGDTTWRESALLAGAGSIAVFGPEGESGITIARAPAAPEMRLFVVNPSVSLSLVNLTLRDGLARGGAGGGQGGGQGGGGAGFGGAIFNQGTLIVSDCTFAGNVAQGGTGRTPTAGFTSGGNGGGPNGGSGGAFSNGTPAGHGTPGGFGGGGGGGGNGFATTAGNGGLGGFGGGGGSGGGSNQTPGQGADGGHGGSDGGDGNTVMAERGGVSGHGAGMGGAIFNLAGSVTIRNSTFTENFALAGGLGASGFGGAVLNYNGVVEATNATLYNNDATAGGALYSLGDAAIADATLNNCICWAAGAVVDVVSTSINGGSESCNGTGNLIGSHVNFDGVIVGSTNPNLGTLQDNGGPAPTHAFLGPSQAIDAGNNSAAQAESLQSDQRGPGFLRIWNGQVDIGALEQIPTGPTGLTTEQIVLEILERTAAPASPDAYDVNTDARLNAADVVTNIGATEP